MSRRLAKLAANLSIVFVCSLPFLVPFSPDRNIDLQGLLLIVAGAFAGLSLAAKPLRPIPKAILVCIGLFVLSCVLSLFVNPHKDYGLFGAPYVRLGTLGLLSCIVCALVIVQQFRLRQIIVCLYGGICVLALVSLPYNLLKFHTAQRIGGLFAQADIMACFLGVGLLLGLYVLRQYPAWRLRLLILQLMLFSLLLLTQTRAVLVLVIGLGLAWLLTTSEPKQSKRTIGYVFAVALVLLALLPILPQRVSSLPYASTSISYRLALQKSALGSSWHRPVLGYGPGNLADALACSKLHDGALQKTCSQHYFFNSSHNIFIDRVLAIGWLGGLSFLTLVILAITMALRKGGECRIIGFAALLVTGYYLTNITSVTLELLFWVLLLGCLMPASRASASP